MAGDTVVSDMIERIVEALKNKPVRDLLEPGGELDELRLREAARAVIGAMREPTPEMVRAVNISVDEHIDYNGEPWRAAIDAALLDSPEGGEG